MAIFLWWNISSEVKSFWYRLEYLIDICSLLLQNPWRFSRNVIVSIDRMAFRDVNMRVNVENVAETILAWLISY